MFRRQHEGRLYTGAQSLHVHDGTRFDASIAAAAMWQMTRRRMSKISRRRFLMTKPFLLAMDLRQYSAQCYLQLVRTVFHAPSELLTPTEASTLDTKPFRCILGIAICSVKITSENDPLMLT